MGTLLLDDLDMLDQQIERANLRLAWHTRLWSLTPAQLCQLQAACLRAFGPHWQQEIEKDECTLGTNRTRHVGEA